MESGKRSSVTVQNLEFPDDTGKQSDRKSSPKAKQPTKISITNTPKTAANENVEIKEMKLRPIFCIPDRNFPSSSSTSNQPKKVKKVRHRITQEQLDWSDSSTKFNAIFTPRQKNVPCFTRKDPLSVDKLVRKSSNATLLSKKTDKNTSQKVIASKATRPKTFFGPEWKLPCEDGSVVAGPKPFIGVCPPQMFRDGIRPPQQFNLTEDPRKKFCLINPEMRKRKTISKDLLLKHIAENIKVAQNINTPSISNTSVVSDVCEVIDLENPVQLDFQGLDYKNTHRTDEQDFINQQEFLRQQRYKKRRDVKAETADNVEKEHHAFAISIPKMFHVIEEKAPAEDNLSPASSIGGQHGKLFRCSNKPVNKEKIAQEEENRRKRYKETYLKRKEKERERQKEAEARQGNEIDLGAIDSDDDVRKNQLANAIEENLKSDRGKHKGLLQHHMFPNTLRDAKNLREELKKTKREIRDRAKVRQEFYKEKLNEELSLREAKLEVSSDSFQDISESEPSNDDEDGITVGKTPSGNCFRLRGFHFKLGTHLRGKYHLKEKPGTEKHRVKGCMTRTEWMNELAPKREKIVLATSIGVSKSYHPDDPNLELFPQKFGLDFKLPETAPIREFRRKPLGRHYERMVRKSILTKKPRQRFKVKKFDLIGFLYGGTDKKYSILSEGTGIVEGSAVQDDIYSYINEKKIRAQALLTLKKRRRMHFLGLPCPPKIVRRKATALCVDSDSDDSNWIPQPVTNNRMDIEKLPLDMRGNMPAPDCRETTLRQNPQGPRAYELLRVPSEQFNEAVHESQVPYLKKLPPNIIQPENVRQMNRKDYTDMFEARHHHDHYDPVQHKDVDVCYAIKTTPAEVLAERDQPKKEERKSDKKSGKKRTAFDKAYPLGKKWREFDRTLPEVYAADLIDEYERKQAELAALKGKKTDAREIKISKDIIYRSRTDEELQQEFPGRQEFLDLLKEIKEEIKSRQEQSQQTAHKPEDDEGEQLVIDKQQFYQELEEDLKSIQSCLTSLESSECTNFTNDSGSYLLVEKETKIPLDFIRKSVIPFEELNRCRFEAVPIDAAGQQANPFIMLPFAGQGKEQSALTGPKEKFHTFNSRLGQGLRLRLEVKPVDPRKELLGPLTKMGAKAPGVVATDIDELYVADLKRCPPAKPFKWNSCRTIIKSALRQKFESMLIQGKLVSMKIYDQKNELHLQQMNRVITLIEKLFSKWEKQEYEAAMAVVHKVKPYYELTDVLKNENRDAERGYMLLNMSIVYIENDAIRRTILQNFHYSLMDMKWRQKHDWIHKDANGKLEGYEESIAKRPFENIRKRDRDDAWAIKDFYENHNLSFKKPILIVFPTAKDFLQGVENLKSITFVLLLELHYTIWILSELQRKDEIFTEWCAVELKAKQIFAETKLAKKYFVEERAIDLEKRLHILLGEPLDEMFDDVEFNKMTAIIGELWRNVVPESLRGSGDSNVPALEQAGMISDVLIELIGKFERIDVEERKKKEAAYRRHRSYLQKQSEKAVRVENILIQQVNNVRKNLAPPYKKPKRVGRVPRSVIKRKVVAKPKVIRRISGRTMFFYKAFHEDDDVDPQTLARSSLNIMENIQESIIPFYFDHFLTINGYTPNYNFKTQIELRDGSEWDRLRKRDLLADVRIRMDQWEKSKEELMKHYINKYPEMYTNVQI